MKNDIRLLCILVFPTLFIISGCDVYEWNQTKITASSEIVRESRSISGFDQLRVCCSIEVSIQPSNQYELEISAPDNVLPLLITEVIGDELHIGFEKGYNIDMHNRQVHINISMPSLAGIRSSSSSEVRTSGDFSGGDLALAASSSGQISVESFNGQDAELSVSSSGKIDLDFRGSEIKAESSSSGRIQLRGEAQSIHASASSSSKILAADCRVRSGDATVSSSGRIELHVLERLVGNARSSGDIYYRGQPEYLNTDTASSGKIKAIN